MAGLQGLINARDQLNAANAQNQSYQKQLQDLQKSINGDNVYTPSYVQPSAPLVMPTSTPNANANWDSSRAITALANAGLSSSSGNTSTWTPNFSVQPGGIGSLIQQNTDQNMIKK